MPALPACLLEPLWDQFAAILPIREEFVVGHLKEWSRQGISNALHALALDAYDRMVGLVLGEISVDGCVTKAPSGGEKAGRSPVDRGKQGLKCSAACDAHGDPLGIVSGGANRHDSPLLGLTLDAVPEQVDMLPDTVNVYLDQSNDSIKSRALIAELGFTAEIARKCVPAPIQASRRWPVERTRSWMNGNGKVRSCTERNGSVGDFCGSANPSGSGCVPARSAVGLKRPRTASRPRACVRGRLLASVR